MAELRLLVGLGNPGAEHLQTRHNVGFWLLDALVRRESVHFGVEARLRGLATRIEVDGHSLRLLEPTTYMNASGASVGAALRYWKIEPEEMLVVHDDLDLPPGSARLKFDGGHGGHNGLRDIMGQLGHGRFHRLRLGIGHPGQPGRNDRVLGWVLGRPSKVDQDAILEAIARALELLPELVAGRFEEAMRKLHSTTNRPATARRRAQAGPVSEKPEN